MTATVVSLGGSCDAALDTYIELIEVFSLESPVDNALAKLRDGELWRDIASQAARVISRGIASYNQFIILRNAEGVYLGLC